MNITRRLRLALILSAVCAAGAVTALFASGSLSSSPISVTEGQTLVADPSTMVDTAKSVSLIDQGKSALCKTTISGVTYYANRAAYAGQYWDQGINALTLAQSLSPFKAPFDTAGNALMLTTITGKKYCMNPGKWPNGQWALAFSTLSSERADLVANPATAGPSISVK